MYVSDYQYLIASADSDECVCVPEPVRGGESRGHRGNGKKVRKGAVKIAIAKFLILLKLISELDKTNKRNSETVFFQLVRYKTR